MLNKSPGLGISFSLLYAFQRYWNREVKLAAKDLRKPKLTKVLIQCYWRSYLLIGIYIFIEVQCSHTVKLHCTVHEALLPLNIIYLCTIKNTHLSVFHPIFYQEVIKVIQPLLLGKLIEFFENNDTTDTSAVYEAYSYAAGISLSTISLAALHHVYFYNVQRQGMKIRVAMCHMIYRKVSQ